MRATIENATRSFASVKYTKDMKNAVTIFLRLFASRHHLHSQGTRCTIFKTKQKLISRWQLISLNRSIASYNSVSIKCIYGWLRPQKVARKSRTVFNIIGSALRFMSSTVLVSTHIQNDYQAVLYQKSIKDFKGKNTSLF